MLPNKTGAAVVAGFKKMFKKTPRRPLHLAVDRGGEFLNANVKTFLKENNITLVLSNNPDVKISIVERFQLTLKIKLFKAFTHLGTYRYCDGLLNDIVHSYNHTHHRSIRMAPAQVSDQNILQVYRNLYGNLLKTPHKRPKLGPGDTVRIQRELGHFEKALYGAWSDETYRITKVLPHPRPVYTLCTSEGEQVIGSFYGEELQKINPPLHTRP